MHFTLWPHSKAPLSIAQQHGQHWRFAAAQASFGGG
jgi:hypothetical protein